MEGHCSKCADPGFERCGTPKGHERKITLESEGDVEVYEVGSGDRVIVLCTDVFGFKYNNARLLADDYAERLPNTRVVIPDYLFGHYMDYRLSKEQFVPAFMTWIKTADPVRSVKVTNELVDHLLKNDKVTDIGIIGFCWGAPSVCSVLQRSEPELKAGVIAHPSRSQGFDPTLLRKPLHILAGDKDEAFPMSFVTKWTQEARPAGLVTFTEHKDCTHGFACRPTNEQEKVESQRAMQITVDYFQSKFD